MDVIRLAARFIEWLKPGILCLWPIQELCIHGKIRKQALKWQVCL